LHQIIKLEALLPNIQRRLESLFVDQIGESDPDTSELEQLCLQFYGKSKSCSLLIDGLDEADDIEQRKVRLFLKKVQRMAGVRILATTHAAMDMSKVFSCDLALCIRPEDLKHDIEVFVQSQISKYSLEELSDCEPFVLDLIRQKLVSDAEGM
jgi:hypothetical protein